MKYLAPPARQGNNNLSRKAARFADPAKAKAIEALLADDRKNTATRDRKGTQRLIANSLTDTATADRLRACTRHQPCRHAACPMCERRKAVRYFRDRLSKAVADTPVRDLRFVTVNMFVTDSLHEVIRLMDKHHRYLRAIIADIRQGAWLHAANGQPVHHRIRVWGAREIEPRMLPDGRVEWLGHVHLLVDLDGLPEHVLSAALRSRWTAPKAVRVEPIRGDTERQQTASLARVTAYGRKCRYTYANGDKREWLPADVIDDLVQWSANRPAQWRHFTLTPRFPVPYTGRHTKTKPDPEFLIRVAIRRRNPTLKSHQQPHYIRPDKRPLKPPTGKHP